ncbi:Ras-related and estrogen-regulated growth inhibitor-like protein [Madurella mycetomatis]|uniref:Ras-related and estrogen-regulated growth inhibitor-like protein n=1 Tax=Madurella mycetomatis TaxID=100816 RepID=A0A175WE59_9PEZI|nr:Ras-related and estrogen-regulated growth inhibitor-like protein [Madurella mycetomatis]
MVNSFVWTPEEAKYLKAVLRWQASASSDDEKRRQLGTTAEEDAARRRQQQGQEKPAGEFRVLVVGGRGTGKTAILTRFGQGTFRGEGEPPDPFYERGCRHPITLDSSGITTPIPPPTNPKEARSQQHSQTYMVDALEMPSKQLLSNPMLEQALNITEAAVLVYDVRDEASLRLARGLADFMREHFSCSPSTPNGNTSGGTPKPSNNLRPYALILVGNKADPETQAGADSDEREREVTWAEGSKAAAAMLMPMPGGGSASGVPFLEVSAKTGENVDQIFPAVGREILRLKRLALQRREQAERAMKLIQEARGVGDKSGEVGARKGKFGLWRSLFVGRRQAAAAVGGEGGY